MKNGKSLEIPLGLPYQEKILIWYATCTADIKSIVITNPAPVTLEKSKDELDACIRHLIDHASGIEIDEDGVRHLTKCAWRMMAMLERTLTDKF